MKIMPSIALLTGNFHVLRNPSVSSCKDAICQWGSFTIRVQIPGKLRYEAFANFSLTCQGREKGKRSWDWHFLYHSSSQLCVCIQEGREALETRHSSGEPCTLVGAERISSFVAVVTGTCRDGVTKPGDFNGF